MTDSTERLTGEIADGSPFDATWRSHAAREQLAVMPSGSAVVTCSAPLGAGGLGRHLLEVLEALGRRTEPVSCICGPEREPDARPSRLRIARAAPSTLLSLLPAPLPPGMRTLAFAVEFDEYAAARLPRAEHLIAFNGQACAQIAAARRAGYRSVSLISANSHLRRVARQHDLAHRRYPIEGSWATQLLKRNLTEYASVERIYVGSQYTRESFLEQGFEDERLSRFQFTPDPRFRPDGARTTPDTFNILYIGSLSVPKGTPLLIDAFRRLPQPDLRLRLVGGWATRGMRRFVERACAEDRRISHGPGDPLPHLRSASLCVHPSYEDGFAYAPAEALACGVPVIVSADTGMKDLLEPGRNGIVLATGDLDALAQAIEATYRGELLGG